MKIKSFLSFSLILCGMFFMASCGEKEDPDFMNDPLECSLVAIETITIDGQDFNKSESSVVISLDDGSGVGDFYAYGLEAFDTNCTEIYDISFDLTIEAGAELEGTYALKLPADAELGDAIGKYRIDDIDGTDFIQANMNGGTVQFTKVSDNFYEIELNVTTDRGENFMLSYRA